MILKKYFESQFIRIVIPLNAYKISTELVIDSVNETTYYEEIGFIPS